MKIKNIPGRLVSFFKEVKIEMKKVNWPSRQETFKYTLIVIGLSVAVAVFLGTLDYILNYLINNLVL